MTLSQLIEPDRTAYILGLFFFVFYSLLFWPFLFLFIYLKNFDLIKSRGWLMSVLQSLVGYFVFFLMSLDGMYLKCFIMLLGNTILIPGWAFPYFLRAWKLYVESYLNYNFLTKAKLNREKDKGPNNFRSNNNNNHIEEDSKSEVYSQKIDLLVKYRWTTKSKTHLIIFWTFLLLTILYTVLLYFFDDKLQPQEVRDEQTELVGLRCHSRHTVYVIVIQYVLVALALLFDIYLLWRVEDSFLFKFELKANLILGSFLFIFWFIGAYVPSFTIFLRPSVVSSLIIFVLFLNSIVLPVLETLRRKRLLRREKVSITDEMNLIEKKGDILDLCLSHETLGPSFERFISQMWCTENVIFYKAVKRYEQMSDHLRKSEAQKIYKNFFVPGSPMEINVDEKVKEKIIENINSGVCDENLFQSAKKVVYDMLRYSVFPLWRDSTLCQEAMKKSGLSDLSQLKADQSIVHFYQTQS